MPCRCIFQFEAPFDQPCWGDEVFYSETSEGDVLVTCEGHKNWLLTQSSGMNRRFYTERKTHVE